LKQIGASERSLVDGVLRQVNDLPTHTSSHTVTVRSGWPINRLPPGFGFFHIFSFLGGPAPKMVAHLSGIVTTHSQGYFTLVMSTYKKCYMGFCTPRRTIMDSKKMVAHRQRVPLAGPSSANEHSLPRNSKRCLINIDRGKWARV